MQGLQAVAFASAYVPGLHSVQVREPGCGANLPASHTRQLAASLAPGDAEKEPAGQGLQAAKSDMPGREEKVPAGHAVQAERETAPGVGE